MKISIFLQLRSALNLVALSSFFIAIYFFGENDKTNLNSFYLYSKSVVQKAIMMFFCRLIIGIQPLPAFYILKRKNMS